MIATQSGRCPNMSKINSFTIWSFTMYHLVERAVAPAFLYFYVTIPLLYPCSHSRTYTKRRHVTRNHAPPLALLLYLLHLLCYHSQHGGGKIEHLILCCHSVKTFAAAKIHIFLEICKDFRRKINFARYFAGLGMVWGRFYPVASSVLKKLLWLQRYYIFLKYASFLLIIRSP